MVLHQQLQSVNTPPPQSSGWALFTETNARLIERIFGPFLVEEEPRKRDLIHPGDRENGNNDFHPHVTGRDAVGRGDVTATILRAREASRMKRSRREAAHKHPSMQQSGTGGHNRSVSTRTMRVLRPRVQRRSGHQSADRGTLAAAPDVPAWQAGPRHETGSLSLSRL